MCKLRSLKQFLVEFRLFILSDGLIFSADEILEKNRPPSPRLLARIPRQTFTLPEAHRALCHR